MIHTRSERLQALATMGFTAFDFAGARSIERAWSAHELGGAIGLNRSFWWDRLCLKLRASRGKGGMMQGLSSAEAAGRPGVSALDL